LPARAVTGQYGDVFSFLSGRPCLDLTTTLQVRHRPQPIESLTTPAQARNWIEQAGLATQVEVDEAGLARLLSLREVIDRLFRARLGGTAAGRADVRDLNDWAARPPVVPTLVGDSIRNHGDLDQVLSTLARDAIELFCAESSSARIRECAHPDCSRLFLDASHAARRRWCGMASCGSKTKSATYRQRRTGA
jgi:predicted RNA-binding Zn ribbon-like protein